MSRYVALVTLVSFVLAPSLGLAQSVPVTHDPVGCMVAGKNPKLFASFPTTDPVANARVHFHSGLATDFYYVPMATDATAGPGGYAGLLPAPSVEAKTVTYYVEVMTAKKQSGRTPDFTAVVVDEEGKCGDKKVAATAPGTVTVFSAGATAIPAGFAAVAGVTVAAAAAGVSTAAIVAGGIVAAGAVTAGVAAASGDNESGSR